MCVCVFVVIVCVLSPGIVLFQLKILKNYSSDVKLASPAHQPNIKGLKGEGGLGERFPEVRVS